MRTRTSQTVGAVGPVMSSPPVCWKNGRASFATRGRISTSNFEFARALMHLPIDQAPAQSSPVFASGWPPDRIMSTVCTARVSQSSLPQSRYGGQDELLIAPTASSANGFAANQSTNGFPAGDLNAS